MIYAYLFIIKENKCNGFTMRYRKLSRNITYVFCLIVYHTACTGTQGMISVCQMNMQNTKFINHLYFSRSLQLSTSKWNSNAHIALVLNHCDKFNIS